MTTIIFELALWWAATASLFLPALSFSGYPLTSIESLIGAVFSLAMAIAFRFLGAIRPLGCILLLTLTVSVCGAYYSGLIIGNYLGMAIFAVFGIVVLAMALVNFPNALRVVGVVGAVQIAAAAISTPSLVRDAGERQAPRGNAASIVHIVVDEHTGIAAIPDEFQANRRRLEELYIGQGFVVFRRAYTLDKYSHLSLARITNPGIADPTTALSLLRDINRWVITQSEAFSRIGAERVLDLTYFDYISYGPSVLDQPSVVRWRSLDSDVAVPSITQFRFSVMDRITIASSKAAAWFRLRAKSKAIGWFFDRTNIGRALWRRSEPTRRTHPIVSRAALSDLVDRLACCGDRGTYYFAHIFFPHYPYVFDATCQTRPTPEWRTRISDRIDQPDTLDSRTLRYALHLEQAECAARDIRRLDAAIGAKPELQDATIIVHSDHGSRISIENRAALADPKYGDRAYERDWRGAFFAVKIPGLAGGAIDRPVRVDKLFDRLIRSGFRGLDLDSISDDGGDVY